MAFEYIHAETGDILDILPQRNNYAIRNHFLNRYSLAERREVKTVIIGMNAGYATIIPELFPQAEIAIDRFHLVQLINRSMNRFRTSNGEDLKKYRRLKWYWKLFLKAESDLSDVIDQHYSLFGQHTGKGIVREMLAYDEELWINYEIYQQLLYTMKKRSFEDFSQHIHAKASPFLSMYMQISLKT